MLWSTLKNSNTISSKRIQIIELKVYEILSSEYIDYIENVYLFGSTARGTADALSDIDMLIEVKDFTSQDVRRHIVSEFYDDISQPKVDVVTITTDFLLNSNERFPREVRKDMVELCRVSVSKGV